MLCFCSICSAQPATIDSISVDETKGELVVWGNLGVSQGFVFVDSLSLPITFWSDSVCRATIPVSGKGSAGLVEIGAKGYRSEGKMLTDIHPFYDHRDWQSIPENSIGFNIENITEWHFRVDIESRISLHILGIKLDAAIDSRNFNLNEEDTEITGYPNYSIHSVTKRDTSFASDHSTLRFFDKILAIHDWLSINLDTIYRPEAGEDNQFCYGQTHGTCVYWGSRTYSFPPRTDYIALAFIPLAFPIDSNYFANDTTGLSWTISPSDLQYEVQIGKDSLFQQIILDSIVFGKSFFVQSKGNGKYFWRVRVKDSVGEGLWSNVAHYQYLLLNNVTEQTFFGFNVFPNPLSSKTSFSFTLPQEEFTSLKIYNTLGNEVATLLNDRLSAGDQRIEFDASHLPSGIYYYRLQIGENVESKPLIVAH